MMNKTIKSILAATFLLGTTTAVQAQQLPVMNHYIYNPYLYNPARTGQNNFGSASMHFKKQWTSLPNSPFTGAISVESPVKTPKLGNMGLGGMLYVDQMHIITKIGGLATYAYHIPFEKNKEYKHGLSAGLSLGFIHQRFNYPDATVENPNDPQLLPTEANGAAFDFSGGIDYQWRGLHVGVSMLQGLNNGLQFFNVNDRSVEYVNARHWNILASYKHLFGAAEKNNRFYIEPSFLGRIIENVPFQAEGNVIAGLDGMGWLGVGYRSSNNATSTAAMIGTIGIEVKRNFMFAYSIEFAVDGQLLANTGTQHEFMLMYRFGDNPKIQEMANKMDSMKIENLQLKEELEKTTTVIKEKVEKIETEVQNNTNNIEKNTETIRDNQSSIQENGSKIDANKKEIDELRKLLENQPLQYKKVGEVFFDNGSTQVDAAGSANLDAVITTIKQMEGQNKEIKIYVKGNASTNGDAKKNMVLSMERAAKVRQYLIDKGMKGEDIMTIPMGESDPTNGGNASAKGESQDRRVDIIFTEKKLKGRL